MRLMISTLLVSLTSIVWLVALAGTAGATVWWETRYDMTGSTNVVNIYDNAMPPPNPPALVSDPQPITGTITVHWGAASVSAPITVGKIVDGETNSDQYFDASVFILTGNQNTVLLPPPYGQFGELSGATFTPGVIQDSIPPGFLHCTAGACALGGFTLSVPSPLTPTTTGPQAVTYPQWNFTGGGPNAGTNFTTPIASVSITGAFLNIIQTQYVGKEISRTFVPEPTLGAMWPAGLGLLAVLQRARRRRTGA